MGPPGWRRRRRSRGRTPEARRRPGRLAFAWACGTFSESVAPNPSVTFPGVRAPGPPPFRAYDREIPGAHWARRTSGGGGGGVPRGRRGPGRVANGAAPHCELRAVTGKSHPWAGENPQSPPVTRPGPAVACALLLKRVTPGRRGVQELQGRNVWSRRGCSRPARRRVPSPHPGPMSPRLDQQEGSRQCGYCAARAPRPAAERRQQDRRRRPRSGPSAPAPPRPRPRLELGPSSCVLVLGEPVTSGGRVPGEPNPRGRAARADAAARAARARTARCCVFDATRRGPGAQAASTEDAPRRSPSPLSLPPFLSPPPLLAACSPDACPGGPKVNKTGRTQPLGTSLRPAGLGRRAEGRSGERSQKLRSGGKEREL